MRGENILEAVIRELMERFYGGYGQSSRRN